jgi:hypothetical protein
LAIKNQLPLMIFVRFSGYRRNRTSGKDKLHGFGVISVRSLQWHPGIRCSRNECTVKVYCTDVNRYTVGNQESVTTSDICPFFSREHGGLPGSNDHFVVGGGGGCSIVSPV